MQLKDLDNWYRDNDVHDFLHKHDLNKDSLVVDIGSYKGSWLHKMNSMYGCRCIGVEPIKEYVLESCKLNFSNYCEINNFGLTTGDLAEDFINMEEDASSMFKVNDLKTRRKIDLKNAKEFFKSIDGKIDVLQINCEGFEYILVPFMAENNLFENVNFLQVQFHDILLDSNLLMNQCMRRIENSGFSTKFNYPFVWYGGEK